MKKLLCALLISVLCFGVCLVHAADFADAELSASVVYHTPMSFVTYKDVRTVAKNLASKLGNSSAYTSAVASFSSFSDTKYATRSNVIGILDCALKDENRTPIGEVYTRPGLGISDPQYARVIAFYRAGILDGNSKAVFESDAYVRIAELNDIVSRIIFPEKRVAYSEAALTEAQAYRLCFTDSMDGQKEGIESGWEFDNRAGSLKTVLSGNSTITDFRDDESSRLIRYFNHIEDDKIELFIRVSFSVNFNGVSLEFCDDSGTPVYELLTKDNQFCILGDLGSYKPVAAGNLGTYTFRFIIDLDGGYSETIINDVYCGTAPLMGDCVRYFALRTGYDTTNVCSIHNMYAYGNYDIYEDFSYNSGIPCDMTSEGNVSFGSTAQFTGVGSFERKVVPIGGKNVSLAYNTYLPNGSNGINVSLTYDDKPVVTISTKNGKFYANGVDLGKAYSDKLWWKMRIEANTETQTADIKINAQTKATVPFAIEAPYFTGFFAENTAATSGAQIDDIRLFNAIDYYVPEPQKPKGEEKYLVCMNICSLWVNGEHWGWSCVSPFDDIKPVLGYYDEGTPISADWENYFMAQHGIDVQAFCWYAGTSNSPMKDTRLGSQLDEGYLYSKYQKDVKFCLLWEAANASRPNTEQDFYDYYIPYFMENYFSNPNYAHTCDGQCIMGIFGASNLVTSFGKKDPATGENILKRMFDELERQIIEGGYGTGLVVSESHGYSNYLEYGFDGCNAYNWGSGAYQLSVNNNQNTKYIKQFPKGYTFYFIPTVSVGFNHIGWQPDDRYPLISVSDYKEALKFMKTYVDGNNSAVSQYRKPKEDDVPWNDNIVWLSTWNEYGEGTYIMPCEGLNGFGYLDAVREVFSDGASAHTDIVPNAEQLETINHNYPQDRRLLRAYGNYVAPSATGNKSFDLTTSATAYKSVFKSQSAITYQSVDSDGSHFITSSTNADAIFYIDSAAYSGMSCESLKGLRVIADVPEGTTMQLFYQTTGGPDLSEANSYRVTSAGSGTREFYFDFSDNPKWTGKINMLRLDPLQKTSTEFAVKSVEFISNCKQLIELYVNGTKLTSHIKGVVDSNDVAYYPFEPGRSLINFYLYCYFDWDYDTKILNAYRDDTTYTFTVGSDKVLINGEPFDLGGKVFQTDNIPMIPIKGLAKAMGFGCYKTTDGYILRTPEEYFFSTGTPSCIGNWTFDAFGNSRGWSGEGSMSLQMTDEYMRATSVSSKDPVMRSPDNLNLSCDTYRYIETSVRVKPDTGDHGDFGYYFTTTTDAGESQTKYVGATVMADGKFHTVLLDMKTNGLWTGTLKRLRCDPFNATGYCDIKYIRLLDENKNPIGGEISDVYISNPDAEETNPDNTYVVDVIPSNADITIIEDPDMPGNHCYQVISQGTGQQWTYFQLATEYTPGKKYQVEYDFKVIGCGAASQGLTIPSDKTVMVAYNARYFDSSISEPYDHIIKQFNVKPSDGWCHMMCTFTVPTSSTSRGSDQFTIYANPYDGHGVNYLVDNLSIKEILE